MRKIWIEMMFQNDGRIKDGHIDYFDSRDADNVIEGDKIEITNLMTFKTEQCKVTSKFNTKHGETGKPAIIVMFKGE